MMKFSGNCVIGCFMFKGFHCTGCSEFCAIFNIVKICELKSRCQFEYFALIVG